MRLYFVNTFNVVEKSFIREKRLAVKLLIKETRYRIVRSAHIPRLALLGVGGEGGSKTLVRTPRVDCRLQGSHLLPQEVGPSPPHSAPREVDYILRSLFFHIVLVKLPCCHFLPLFDIFILASWPVAGSFLKRRVFISCNKKRVMLTSHFQLHLQSNATEHKTNLVFFSNRF